MEKLKENEKNELISCLPDNIKMTKELSKNQKIVFAYLWSFRDSTFLKDNGYFFITNKELSDAVGLSQRTIVSVISKLIELGFIFKTTGKKGVANHYSFNSEKIKNYDASPVQEPMQIATSPVQEPMQITQNEPVKLLLSKLDEISTQVADLKEFIVLLFNDGNINEKNEHLHTIYNTIYNHNNRTTYSIMIDKEKENKEKTISTTPDKHLTYNQILEDSNNATTMRELEDCYNRIVEVICDEDGSDEGFINTCGELLKKIESKKKTLYTNDNDAGAGVIDSNIDFNLEMERIEKTILMTNNHQELVELHDTLKKYFDENHQELVSNSVWLCRSMLILESLEKKINGEAITFNNEDTAKITPLHTKKTGCWLDDVFVNADSLE